MVSKVDKALQQTVAMYRDCTKMVKLWENASPTSAFMAQTITVSNLLGYNKYVIYCKTHITENSVCSFCAPTNYGLILNYNDINSIYRRLVNIAGNQITFSTLGGIKIETKAGISDNSHLVPISIYGIKE